VALKVLFDILDKILQILFSAFYKNKKNAEKFF